MKLEQLSDDLFSSISYPDLVLIHDYTGKESVENGQMLLQIIDIVLAATSSSLLRLKTGKTLLIHITI